MIKLRTQIPGRKSARVLEGLKKKNGGWGVPHPLVFKVGSARSKRVHCEDIDGNLFLDFACQVASSPLGYNHSKLVEVVKKYAKHYPVKYAGQDFTIEKHLDLIESLIGISPSGMNAAFIVNSGAEAVENAIKIAMHNRKKKKFGVSVSGAFHGRTLGALSLHHSKALHRKGYMLEPNLEVPFGDEAEDALDKIVKRHGADAVSFVILEHLQGEGGYRIPSREMVKGLRRITKKHGIPYIADEVQAGMGRTGKWWAFEHYGIKPDVFSSAKALQVGATVSSKKMFPSEPGSISSTWGGGPLIDMALGIKTIEIIKKEKLLSNINKMGNYIMKSLNGMDLDNVRGRGLMIAFDLNNSKERDNAIVECIKNGLLILGAGKKSIRIIPPYIIRKQEADEGLAVIEKAVRAISKKGFKHKGKICQYMGCAESTT